MNNNTSYVDSQYSGFIRMAIYTIRNVAISYQEDRNFTDHDMTMNMTMFRHLCGVITFKHVDSLKLKRGGSNEYQSTYSSAY